LPQILGWDSEQPFAAGQELDLMFIQQMRKNGFTPESIINYCALLGIRYNEEMPIENPDGLEEQSIKPEEEKIRENARESIRQGNKDLLVTQQLCNSEFVPFSFIEKKFDIEKINSRWCYWSLERLKLIGRESLQKKLRAYQSQIDNEPSPGGNQIYDFESQILDLYPGYDRRKFATKSPQTRRKLITSVFNRGFIYSWKQIALDNFMFTCLSPTFSKRPYILKYFKIQENLDFLKNIIDILGQYFGAIGGGPDGKGSPKFINTEIYKLVSYSCLVKEEPDAYRYYLVLSYGLTGKKAELKSLDVAVLMEFLGYEET
jgi:hypothetical protein